MPTTFPPASKEPMSQFYSFANNHRLEHHCYVSQQRMVDSATPPTVLPTTDRYLTTAPTRVSTYCAARYTMHSPVQYGAMALAPTATISDTWSHNNNKTYLTMNRAAQAAVSSEQAMTTQLPFYQRAPSTPPALPRRLPIGLPALSPNIPIETHPLITYRYSTTGFNPALLWNISLPPSAARLAPALSNYENSGWLRHPALQPQIIDSMTIRVPSVDRPIVVFPVRTGNAITIEDVLKAISRALREALAWETTEDFTEPLDPAGGNTKNPAIPEAMATRAMGAHFRRRLYWSGLSKSPVEREVWILQLHYANRRGRV